MVYFKRYRMQFEILGSMEVAEYADPQVHFEPWRESLTGLHASAKWESFRREIDANVFPCLGDREGCQQLMREIAGRTNYVPEATWLAVHQTEPDEYLTPIGTIQGLRSSPQDGAIQNIGVVPSWRGRGIGKQLIQRALVGFQSVGCRRVSLEVTVHNASAIRLYESLGFERVETVFKVGNLAINERR